MKKQVGEILAFLEKMRAMGFEVRITPNGGFVGVKKGAFKSVNNANFKSNFSA
ncbi:MAG: hypothetical protein LUC34_00860 [Campylobacter sp.]|nr:hypothetical protein [Campylobacter sp.]